MNVPPLIQSFVLHFGEMGNRWGINRTVGQIYALLYVSPRPLCAEQIAEALGISRSNVSMPFGCCSISGMALTPVLPLKRCLRLATNGAACLRGPALRGPAACPSSDRASCLAV